MNNLALDSPKPVQLRRADERFRDGQRRHFLVASLPPTLHPSLRPRTEGRHAHVREEGPDAQLGHQGRNISGSRSGTFLWACIQVKIGIFKMAVFYDCKIFKLPNLV